MPQKAMINDDLADVLTRILAYNEPAHDKKTFLLSFFSNGKNNVQKVFAEKTTLVKKIPVFSCFFFFLLDLVQVTFIIEFFLGWGANLALKNKTDFFRFILPM